MCLISKSQPTALNVTISIGISSLTLMNVELISSLNPELSISHEYKSFLIALQTTESIGLPC